MNLKIYFIVWTISIAVALATTPLKGLVRKTTLKVNIYLNL